MLVVGGMTFETIESIESFNEEADSIAVAERFEPASERVGPLTEENFFSLVYPNPSDGLLNVEFKSANEQYVQLDLYDESGRLIRNLFSRQLQQPGQRTIQVDVSDQPPGIYLVRISAGDRVETEPVIIAGN
jgi:hypothetical protein